MAFQKPGRDFYEGKSGHELGAAKGSMIGYQEESGAFTSRTKNHG